MVTMVDIVVVEADVVGVLVFARREVNLLTVFDMVFKTPIVDRIVVGFSRIVTVSPSPQSKDEENEKLHKLREYARDFRRQHTTDAEQFDWDLDDGDYGLAIGRLVVT
jgi:hypothetical protein